MQILGILGTICAMGLLLILLKQIKILDAYTLQKKKAEGDRKNESDDQETIKVQEEMIKNLEDQIKIQNEMLLSQQRIIKLMEEKLELYEKTYSSEQSETTEKI